MPKEYRFHARLEKQYNATQKTLLSILKTANKDNIKHMMKTISTHPKVVKNWPKEARQFLFPMMQAAFENGTTIPMTNMKKMTESLYKYWHCLEVFRDGLVPAKDQSFPEELDKCIVMSVLYCFAHKCGLTTEQIRTAYNSICDLISVLQSNPKGVPECTKKISDNIVMIPLGWLDKGVTSSTSLLSTNNNAIVCTPTENAPLDRDWET